MKFSRTGVQTLCLVSFVLSVLLISPTLTAQSKGISVDGLFLDKAIVNINGNRHLMKIGDTRDAGRVRLLSSDSERAIIEVDGKRQVFRLAKAIGGFSSRRSSEVKIKRDLMGMYKTHGHINGRPVSFLVDTGASQIALSARKARELNIDYRSGKRGYVTTASERKQAYGVKLRKVKVGEIELYNIGAIVLDGNYPTEVLLGMTFLGKLEMVNKGQVLTLKKAW